MKGMQNKGDIVTVVAPYDLASGAFGMVGDIGGFAQTAALSGANVPLVTRGVFNNAVKATGETWAVGDKLYWHNTNKNFTKTSSGAVLAAAALSVQGSGDLVGTVRLRGAMG